MSEPKRGRAYTWVTWITGILAGTDHCKWKPWYKAHHKYAKVPPDDPDFLVEWTKTHDAMTEARAAKMKEEGWIVRVEDDNAFKLEGQTVTLAGKADLIGLRGGVAMVIDEKSGKERDSDLWQVLIYMFALPLTWLKGHHIEGYVEYRGGRLKPVPPLDDEKRKRITEVMRMVGSDIPPSTAPSRNECKFCDIVACKDRFKGEADGGETQLF